MTTPVEDMPEAYVVYLESIEYDCGSAPSYIDYQSCSIDDEVERLHDDAPSQYESIGTRTGYRTSYYR